MHKADRPDNEGRVVSAPPIECLLYGTASCMSCRTAPTPLNGSQRTTNMKASRLTTVLENLLDQPWAAFIWGAPGIGKSSIVRQIAERRRMPLIDIRASLLDPTDLRGIPMIQDGTAVWCPPSFLPKKSDKPGILFLDEINAAPPLVQAALYQLILDRRVGEYELPEGWRIIAAGNRREDKAVTFRLSSALANRFIHLNLEVDPDDWHAWATNRGIIPEVTAFLKYRPQLLQAASEDEQKSDKPGILFLDEINAAPPLVQAALYQLILDRRVGEYELPEGWRIIAAGNRREDKAVTFRLSSALANRFIHLNLEVDPDDWHAWATNRGIIPEVTAFLKYRPQLLQAASEDEQAFATPRSWEMVSDVVAKFGSPAKARDVIPGIVGTGPAVEFLTFAKKAVLRKEIDAIIADPAGATIPTELDRLWVLVSFLVAGAQNDGILKIVPTLLPRLPVEFSIVLLRDLIRCRPQIVQEKGVSDFLKTNKVMLF